MSILLASRTLFLATSRHRKLPRLRPDPPRPRHTRNPASAKSEQAVDVDAVSSDLAARRSTEAQLEDFIVDLMKLLGIDSSLENRKELARELGYVGDTNDSAAMDVWLHKRVMQELEKNGGKVPASLVA